MISDVECESKNSLLESVDVSYSTSGTGITCFDFNAYIIDNDMCLVLDDISDAAETSSCDTIWDETDTSSCDENSCTSSPSYADQLTMKKKRGKVYGSTSKKNVSRIREIRSSQIRDIKFSRRRSYLDRFIDKNNKEEKDRKLPIYSEDQNGSRCSDDPTSSSSSSYLSDGIETSSRDTTSDETDTSSCDENRRKNSSSKKKTGKNHGLTSKKNASRTRDIKSIQMREIELTRRRSYLDHFINKTHKQEKENCQEKSKLPTYSADQNGSRLGGSDDPTSSCFLDGTKKPLCDTTWDETDTSSCDENRCTNSSSYVSRLATKRKTVKFYRSTLKKNASRRKEIKSSQTRKNELTRRRSYLDRFIDKTNKQNKENCQEGSKPPTYSSNQNGSRRSDDATSSIFLSDGTETFLRDTTLDESDMFSCDNTYTSSSLFL